MEYGDKNGWYEKRTDRIKTGLYRIVYFLLCKVKKWREVIAKDGSKRKP
jgi:hypothetical protein